MKKQYKLMIEYDDALEEIDNLTETLEREGQEDIWLDTGEVTILLPKEIAEYLEANGIMGLA